MTMSQAPARVREWRRRQLRRVICALLPFLTLMFPVRAVFADAVTPQIIVGREGITVRELHFGMVADGDASLPRQINVLNASNVVLYEFGSRVAGTTCAYFTTPPPLCFREAASYTSVDDCPEDLHPGESCTLSVVFRPSGTGSLVARLLLIFDAPFSSIAPNGFETGALLQGSGTPLLPFTSGLVPVVEYYSQSLDHYFLTVSPDEMSALDAGDIAGWERTGLFFWAYPSGGPVPDSEQPVCRYYGRPEAGLNTHFYSASADECVAVADNFAHAWTLEDVDHFRVGMPSVAGGCSNAPRVRAYRVYNGRPDVNHRFTTSDAVLNFMKHQRGWVQEGYGTINPIALCTPL